jgi:hypothetical protein
MLFTSGTGNDFKISVGIGLSCSALASSSSLAFLAKPSGPKAFFCFAMRVFSSFSMRSATAAEGFPSTTILLGWTKYLNM